MVKDHSVSEMGNLLLPLHWLLFSISSKGFFYGPSHRQNSTYHDPWLHQSWSTGWNDKYLNGFTKRDQSDDPLQFCFTKLPTLNKCHKIVPTLKKMYQISTYPLTKCPKQYIPFTLFSQNSTYLYKIHKTVPTLTKCSKSVSTLNKYHKTVHLPFNFFSKSVHTLYIIFHKTVSTLKTMSQNSTYP